MFAGLPRVIRVGGFDVRIEIRDEIRDKIGGSKGEDRTIFGQYTHEDMLIEINVKQASPAFAEDTVRHELLHVIWADRALTDDDSEERIIDQLSRGYGQVLRDNPKYLKWLIKSLG